MRTTLKQFKNYELWMMLLFLMAGFVFRAALWEIQSNDYVVYLSKWYNHIDDGGGLQALLTLDADYNLPYQYVMVLMTKLPISSLHAIKLFSLLFDFVLAAYAYLIVKEVSKNPRRAILCSFLIFTLPTVLMNSSGWAQSDSIYTALLLATIYYIIKDKPVLAILMYTISFSFKIQAVFLAPIMLVLLLKGFFKLRHLIVPALFYVLISLPVVSLGSDFAHIFRITLGQVGIREGFSFFLPNFYYVFPLEYLFEYNSAKYYLIGFFFALCTVFILKVYHKIELSNSRNILFWSYISVLFVPYFLLRMHERYYYPATCLATVLLFTKGKRFLWPLLTLEIASITAYITVEWWNTSSNYPEFSLLLLKYLYPSLSAIVGLAMYWSVKNALKGN